MFVSLCLCYKVIIVTFVRQHASPHPSPTHPPSYPSPTHPSPYPLPTHPPTSLRRRDNGILQPSDMVAGAKVLVMWGTTKDFYNAEIMPR